MSPMQLTRYTDYALRVLILVALSERGAGPAATVSEAAERFQVSKNHLNKIVHHLRRQGYLETLRGRRGGIRLGQAVADIRIGAVVRDMEPTLDVIDCQQPPCPIACGCRLRGALRQARDAFLAVLDGYTLADIVQEPERLRWLLASALPAANTKPALTLPKG